MKLGIIKEKEQIMVKLLDDFSGEDIEENYVCFFLDNKNAKELADKILEEIANTKQS